MNCKDSTNTSNCPNDYDQSRVGVLKASLKRVEGRKNILLEKAEKHEQLKSEIENMKSKLDTLKRTKDEKKDSHKQCLGNLVRQFDQISLEYDQKSKNIAEIKRENHELESSIRSMTCNELKTLEEIKTLESARSKVNDCNKALRNKINKEKETLEALRRRVSCLEDAVREKTAAVDTARRELAETTDAVRSLTGKTNELRRQHADCGRALRDATDICRDREAKLAAFKESGPPQVVAADRATESARAELADASAVAVEWTGRRERADEEHRRLRADGEAQAVRSRAVLKEYGDAAERLNGRLAETSRLLTAAVKDARQLTAGAKAEADRLAVLTAEVERLGQRAYHERFMQAARAAGCNEPAADSPSPQPAQGESKTGYPGRTSSECSSTS